MNVFPLQNANSSVISVTGTASYILPLIDAAGAVTHSFYQGIDALDITPENGDIRIITDPSTAGLAPTASKGFLIKQGATLMLRHTAIRYIKAIAVSGTVSCSLQVGTSVPGETTVISGSGSGGTGASASQTQGNAASGATDSGNPVKTGGVYNSTPPTLTNGQRGDTQLDSRANTQVNVNTLFAGENLTNKALGIFNKFYNSTNQKAVSVTYTSFTTQAIASSVPLTLVCVRILNTTASARYLYMNNASSISGGAAPSITPALIPASGERVLTHNELGGNGEVFSTALTIGNSSTAATFTAGSAGDLIVTLHYVTATS